jgi:hypothetical protein
MNPALVLKSQKAALRLTVAWHTLFVHHPPLARAAP